MGPFVQRGGDRGTHEGSRVDGRRPRPVGRIAAHDFEPEGDALTFTGRLARDHGWSLAVACGAVEEYRRFCFLAVRSDVQVTPSEEVDEVWHQHLTFSRDYWQVWCRDVLRRDLHHQPTRGGASEEHRFADQYARTLACYEVYFGPPAVRYWPGTAERFGGGPRFRIIDRAEHMVVPIPASLRTALRWSSSLLGLSLIASILFIPRASAATLGILDWTAGPFLGLYTALCVAALAAVAGLPTMIGRGPRESRHPGALSCVELALLTGGFRRAADVMALEGIAAGHLSLPGGGMIARVATSHEDRRFFPIGDLPSGPLRRGMLVKSWRPVLDRAWDRLAADGLALSRSDIAQRRIVAACIVSPVMALGVAKLVVGLERGKPVGYLFALVVLLGTIAVWIELSPRLATRQGWRAASCVRDENARAMRAPTTEEAIMAFAIVGTGALMGTAFEAYKELIRGDGRDAGGGGCSGGGGGGGCGGCGGGGD